jgi:hypothetical protein
VINVRASKPCQLMNGGLSILTNWVQLIEMKYHSLQKVYITPVVFF